MTPSPHPVDELGLSIDKVHCVYEAIVAPEQFMADNET
jgi:hypothetical protein